jgi:hypothetical protein
VAAGDDPPDNGSGLDFPVTQHARRSRLVGKWICPLLAVVSGPDQMWTNTFNYLVTVVPQIPLLQIHPLMTAAACNGAA